MKIISKFKDYYDSIQALGIDENVQYIRSTSILHTSEDMASTGIPSDLIEMGFRYKESPSDWYLGSTSVMGTEYIHRYKEYPTGPEKVHRSKRALYFMRVFFCGKFYTAVYLPGDDRYYPTNKDIRTRFFYSLESLKGFFDGMGAPLEEYKPRVKGFLHNFENSSTCEPLAKLLQEKKVVAAAFGISRIWDSMGERTFVLDPCLADLGFQAVKDPYLAYQEIDMYISGVIGSPAKPLIQASDEVRLEKHGFDKKTSFRKAPTKRRK